MKIIVKLQYLGFSSLATTYTLTQNMLNTFKHDLSFQDIICFKGILTYDTHSLTRHARLNHKFCLQTKIKQQEPVGADIFYRRNEISCQAFLLSKGDNCLKLFYKVVLLLPFIELTFNMPRRIQIFIQFVYNQFYIKLSLSCDITAKFDQIFSLIDQ